MTEAKRGDLVIIHQHHRDFILRGEPREYDTYTVGVVTSVTRDGMVKMWKEADHIDRVDYRGKADRGQSLPSAGFVRAIIGPAADIDVTGALATAACHVWGTGESHETHLKAYESLAELQAALKAHRRSESSAAILHEAAARHATARREAWDAYQRETVQRRGGWDSERYHVYETNVRAANDAYRAACAALSR